MIEVLKQALEAFEAIPEEIEGWIPDKCTDAVIAIKQAIAELESQEPDKYEMDIECTKCGAKQSGVLTVNTHPPQRTEPKVCCQQYDTCLEPCTPRGMHLAQRTWVGLTDEEIRERWFAAEPTPDGRSASYNYARAIEAKLKQKNGFAEEKNNG